MFDGFIKLHHLIQFLSLFVVLGIVSYGVGLYLERIYTGKPAFINRILFPVERFIYRLIGLPHKEGMLISMTWKDYILAITMFSLVSFAFLFSITYFQSLWTDYPDVSAHLAFNIAASFVTNTSWQGYNAETTLANNTQMIGLTVENFVTSSVGMSVMVTLFRGIIQKNTCYIGNFWQDMTRSILYVYIPFCLIGSLVLMLVGGVQTFETLITYPLLEGGTQTVHVGPIASQMAIKQIGVNGAGFLSANAAHPFENPNAISNLIQIFMMMLVPVASCFMYGKMVGNMRQGMMILGVIITIFVPLFLISLYFEVQGNPSLRALGVDQMAGAMQSGGNFEGKETRFGTFLSMLWASVTTASSCGAANAAHDSFMPLAGMIPMFFMQLGEIIMGASGVGMYVILGFVLLTVFMTGLMVGRTPEYLGKRIAVFDIKMIAIIVSFPSVVILTGAAIAMIFGDNYISSVNYGPHVFSEILYNVASTTNNNGSAFAGLNTNTPFYNTLLGICTILGRFVGMFAVVVLAGSLSEKNVTPSSIGVVKTDTFLFMCILIGVIFIGALNFVPSLALGPVAEYFNMIKG